MVATSPLRVFVVDDSLTARRVLRSALERDGAARVVGEATNGKDAVQAIPTSGAELVLMDVVMPVMDGVAATRELMRRSPVPIVLISDLVGRQAARNFEPLAAGALDLLGKPTVAELNDPAVRARLLRKLRALAGVPLVTRRFRDDEAAADNSPARWSDTPPAAAVATGPAPTLLRPAAAPRPATAADLDWLRGTPTQLVAIGASTGGPPALAQLLQTLGGHAPWPILITQHITVGFTRGLADWLALTSGLRVELAANGASPEPGTAYLAPDERHLRFRGRYLELLDAPPRHGHRPSVDVMFESLVDSGTAPQAVAILLTGMGADGAEGLLRLRQAGARTLAQDEATSVVYGMPRVAAELNAAAWIGGLAEIGRLLVGLAGGGAAARALP